MPFATFSTVILQLNRAAFVTLIFMTALCESMAQTKCPPFQPKNQQEAQMVENSSYKNVCWSRDSSGNLTYTSSSGPNVYRPMNLPTPTPSGFTPGPPSPLDPAGKLKPASFEGSWVVIAESWVETNSQYSLSMTTFMGRIDIVVDPISKGYLYKVLPSCIASDNPVNIKLSADGTLGSDGNTVTLVKVDGTHLRAQSVVTDTKDLWVMHYVRVARGDATGVELTQAPPRFLRLTDGRGRLYIEDFASFAVGQSCNLFLLPGNYASVYGSFSVSSGTISKLALPSK